MIYDATVPMGRNDADVNLKVNALIEMERDSELTAETTLAGAQYSKRRKGLGA